MKYRASHKKRLEWSQRIDEWKSSGLSMRKWCDKNAITYQTFLYWRDRLLKNLGEKEPIKSPESGCSFFEIADTPKVQYCNTIIVLGNDFDVNALSRALQALGVCKC